MEVVKEDATRGTSQWYGREKTVGRDILRLSKQMEGRRHMCEWHSSLYSLYIYGMHFVNCYNTLLSTRAHMIVMR